MTVHVVAFWLKQLSYGSFAWLEEKIKNLSFKFSVVAFVLFHLAQCSASAILIMNVASSSSVRRTSTSAQNREDIGNFLQNTNAQSLWRISEIAFHKGSRSQGSGEQQETAELPRPTRWLQPSFVDEICEALRYWISERPGMQDFVDVDLSLIHI